MEDYTDLKNKFKTDDTPTGNDYGELIDLVGSAKDIADQSVIDNKDGTITMNGTKLKPVTDNGDGTIKVNGVSYQPVVDNKDNTITINGETVVPVNDNQDGTITVNTQRYTPADASKVVQDNKDGSIIVNGSSYFPVYTTNIADTIASQQGNLEANYDLNTLRTAGTYYYGGNNMNFVNGPTMLVNKPRWGTVLVWKHGYTIFQQIYTNLNEIFYRVASGPDSEFSKKWQVYLLADETTATNFEDYKSYVDNQLAEMRDSINAGLPTIDPDFMNEGIVVGNYSNLQFGGYRRVEFNKFIITELKFTIQFKSGLTTGDTIITFPFKVTNSAFNFMDVQSKVLCGFKQDGTTFQYIRMASGYDEQPSYTDYYDFHSVFIYDK